MVVETDSSGGALCAHASPDLKADNCFVDSARRVKVADFGTGVIADLRNGSAVNRKNSRKNGTVRPSRPETRDDLPHGPAEGVTKPKISRKRSIVRRSNHALQPDDDQPIEYSDRTLSQGVGTLLWMSPEALSGIRVSEEQGRKLDVYSYAIVLWEIWARTRPWDEIIEEEAQFQLTLCDLVISGQRPRLPTAVSPAPDGYQALMEKCWAGAPEQRPQFFDIVEVLDTMERGRSSTSDGDRGIAERAM